MSLPQNQSALARIRSYLETYSLEPQRSLFPAEESATRVEMLQVGSLEIPRYINEFWTARQRQAASIHEISYRACFKPQLPRFFIELLSQPGQTVYDPFCGRGTTALEAALLGRQVVANDINPLSEILVLPRFRVPDLDEVACRLRGMEMDSRAKAELDLSMFFHPRTEAEIVSLRRHLRERRASGQEDDVDRWIRMVATNRLTGHSAGFFSVYTLPPNQAISPQRQREINSRLGQAPPYRDTREIILRKSRRLLSNMSRAQMESLRKAGSSALFLTRDARRTPEIPSGAVQLTVTSPPFLDVVQYSNDNWLRCWFNGIDQDRVAASITQTGSLSQWCRVMEDTLKELHRLTSPGGWVAFEVGEVRGGTVSLDEEIVPLGVSAGFCCLGVVVNAQRFTKTSNIWGVDNSRKGTNTNRIVLFQKEP
jgi:SAM-dependent methyltransferase